jgi:hypothetical protein
MKIPGEWAETNRVQQVLAVAGIFGRADAAREHEGVPDAILLHDSLDRDGGGDVARVDCFLTRTGIQ